MIKKTLLKKIFTIILMSIVLMPAEIQAATKKITYKQIKNEQLGLSFKRPKAWNQETTKSGDGYVDYSLNIAMIEGEDKLAGTIGITRADGEAGKKLILKEEVKAFKSLFQDFKNFQVVTEKNKKFLGKKGKEIVLSFKNPTKEEIIEKVIITMTIAKNKVYLILMDEEETQFEKYLPIYNAMKNSIKIKE